MMRKFLSVLLLSAVIAVLLCGCAKSFTYTYYVDTAGAVHRNYRLEYDAEAADAETVLAEAKKFCDRLITGNGWETISEVDTKTAGVVELRVTYPTLADYYIALGRTGKEERSVESENKEGVLTSYVSTMENVYSEDFILSAKAALGAEYEDADFTSLDFYYVYGTRYRTTKSNADHVQESDGIYYHTWKLVPGEDHEIEITDYSLNGMILYIVIISVFVLSLLVLFVIIFIKDKKTKAMFRSVSDAQKDGSDTQMDGSDTNDSRE